MGSGHKLVTWVAGLWTDLILSKINPLIQSDWATVYGGVLWWLWSVCGGGRVSRLVVFNVDLCVYMCEWWNKIEIYVRWKDFGDGCAAIDVVVALIVGVVSLSGSTSFDSKECTCTYKLLNITFFFWVRNSKHNLDKITRPIQLKQSQHYQSILNSYRHSQHVL